MKTEEELLNQSSYAQKAMNLFQEGYNCSQSVMLAFQDLHGLDEHMAAKISSSFGGGMGRLREVCGGVSGMFMVIGLLYGYEDPKAIEDKTDHYKRIQELAARFEEYNHSIVCRELLGLGKGKDSFVPSERTDAYYKKRPCKVLVGMAAAFVEEYIKENPLES